MARTSKVGTHKMPNGKTMKNSDMYKSAAAKKKHEAKESPKMKKMEKKMGKYS